jgi:hypothetical protein
MDVQTIATDTVDQPEAQAAAPPQASADAPYDPSSFYADDQPKEPTEALGEAGDGEDGLEPTGDDVVDPDAPDADAIEAPISWAKDAKDIFGKLPREAQEIISARERDRETFLQAKSREAAQTRATVESEARGVLQQVATNFRQQVEQLQAVIIPVPEAPDQRLLYSPDPEHHLIYNRQKAEYESAIAQRDGLAQQISSRMEEAKRLEDAASQQQEQAELQAEHSLLEEKLGQDWSDPSSRAKLLGDLTPIAAELGYSKEQIAQARACDILAMKRVHELKAKADKYDALQKAKMAQVRAGKVIPPAARPQSPTGTRAPVDAAALLYPNDVRR